MKPLFYAAIMLFSCFALPAQEKRLELLSIDEMEKLVKQLGEAKDAEGLLKCMRQTHPSLQEMAMMMVMERDIKLPLGDVADIIKDNADARGHSEDAVSHQNFKKLLIDYVNKATGKNYRYQFTVDPAPYLKMAEEVKALAANPSSTSGSQGAIPSTADAIAQRTTTRPHEPAKPTSPSFESSERGWLVWLAVVIVAAGGAVWLFLRKSPK